MHTGSVAYSGGDHTCAPPEPAPMSRLTARTASAPPHRRPALGRARLRVCCYMYCTVYVCTRRGGGRGGGGHIRCRGRSHRTGADHPPHRCLMACCSPQVAVRPAYVREGMMFASPAVSRSAGTCRRGPWWRERSTAVRCALRPNTCPRPAPVHARYIEGVCPRCAHHIPPRCPVWPRDQHPTAPARIAGRVHLASD